MFAPVFQPSKVRVHWSLKVFSIPKVYASPSGHFPASAPLEQKDGAMGAERSDAVGQRSPAAPRRRRDFTWTSQRQRCHRRSEAKVASQPSITDRTGQPCHNIPGEWQQADCRNTGMADINSTRRDSTDSEGIPSCTCGACRFEKSLQVATAQPQYLSKMLEGYHHFLSLRKAAHLTLTLIEERPTFENGSAHEVPQSNFDTSKKMHKIEARLIKDTVEQFFAPFGSLPPEEKSRVLEGFYCIFSIAERAFRTYKTFPAGDDHLLMPDGGYIRLSELQKFYENNNLIRGDSAQVAIETATTYIVSVVVAHMRSIDLSEVELMALVGMFLWKDKADVSEDTMATMRRTRDNILVDLHNHYSTSGYAEHDLTIKTANLLLLIPKLENVELAAFFNLMDAAQLPHDVPQQFSELCD
ncbi:Protein NHR-33 [Aphelenchoides avenae]|nr:Protein NHR-33 [Aphelenchus avenae]